MTEAGEHTKRDETPEWWFRQIEAAQQLYRQRVSKEHYRPQLRNVYNLEVAEYFVTNGGEAYQGADAVPGDQVNLLYLPRHKEWQRSQVYDSAPEILPPQSGGDGNEQTAEMVGELQERVGYDAQEWEEWRGTLDDFMENGAYAMWYGIHTEAPHDAHLAGMRLSAGDAVEAVIAALMEGEGYEALPGQDHETIAGALEAAAGNEETVLAPGGERLVDALEEAALAHRRQAERDANGPQEWTMERAAIWSKRSPVGTCTVWDPTVDDVRDARWVARLVVMDVDVARSHPTFKQNIRKDIQSGFYSTKDGWVGNEVRQDAGEIEGSDKAKPAQVQTTHAPLWQIWDRKYRKVHWIQGGMKSFLERSDRSPFLGIPGFVPCVIRAPLKHNKANPTRPFGIPGGAIGWPIQKAIIKLASYDLELVKKLSARVFVYDESADETRIQALAAGVPGAGIRKPKDVEGPIIEPVNFGTVPPEVFHRLQAMIQRLSELMAWPLSQMTGAPQSDTATGEEVAVAAGTSQLGDYVRVTQDAMAEGALIKAALMRQFFTPEQVAGYVGLQYTTREIDPQTGEEVPSLWDMWREADGLGDRYTVRLAPTAANEDPIRREQLRQGIEMLMGLPGPAPGLPMFGPDKIMSMLRELFRTMGSELPEPTEYTPEQIQQALVAATAASAPKPQAKPGGDTKRDGKPNRRPVRGDLAPSAG